MSNQKLAGKVAVIIGASKGIGAGRVGKSDDVGPVAVFLASSGGAWISGETIRIAGGLR